MGKEQKAAATQTKKKKVSMAATATAAKPKTRTAATPTVETSEVTEVIVDSGLKRLMILWK